VVAFSEQSDTVRFDTDAHTEIRFASVSAALWRKSSYSACNGNCVEVAELPGGWMGVRDTKDGGLGPALLFEATAWRSFIERVKEEA
jgi:hypothetical protein